MEFNSRIVKIKMSWHTARIYYYRCLADCCLDSDIQGKLDEKIMYHNAQLNLFQSIVTK
jgi:hypothetical protein